MTATTTSVAWERASLPPDVAKFAVPGTQLYALVPNDVTMAMMLPPPSEFVNAHPNCFHLYECRCEGRP